MLCLQQKVHIWANICPQAPHQGALCDQCDQEGDSQDGPHGSPKAPLSRALCLTRESIGGVLPCGAVSDCGYRNTVPHVFVDSRSIEEASGETTSTDKLEVEMLPHMAEGCVGVLIDDSAVWTEGELPVLSLEVERLSHEASVSVEVT